MWCNIKFYTIIYMRYVYVISRSFPWHSPFSIFHLFGNLFVKRRQRTVSSHQLITESCQKKHTTVFIVCIVRNACESNSRFYWSFAFAFTTWNNTLRTERQLNCKEISSRNIISCVLLNRFFSAMIDVRFFSKINSSQCRKCASFEWMQNFIMD